VFRAARLFDHLGNLVVSVCERIEVDFSCGAAAQVAQILAVADRLCLTCSWPGTALRIRRRRGGEICFSCCPQNIFDASEGVRSSNGRAHHIAAQQQRPRGFVPLFRPSPVLGWSGRYYCYFASVLPWRAVDALSLRVERCDLQPGSCFHGGTVFL
jgi:hypothetical protein